MRRLIINADDLGLTAGVNRAIVEAHERGVVSSATMMSNAGAVDDAVVRAREAGLGVGCHVVLIDGAPMLPPKAVSSLVVEDGAGARFRDGWLGFASRALRKRLDEDQIAAEVEAQIRKIQQTGLRVTHVDSHKHAHLLPPVLRPMLAAAKACGVRAVRNPFAPLKPLAMVHLARRPRLWTRYSEVKLLRRFSQEFCKTVGEAGMVTTDGTFGILVTGALDEELFAAIVGSLPEGTWEFVCHPGYCDAELRAVRTRLRESREQELRVLTSAAARRAIEAAGVELISYAELNG
ncbi:MAG TPA: ChbG/HpnK family deacetylase [Terriglobales bacterium]|nr:ChbG/HpnK family deacetylase [Terriglobales bacterium]